MSQLHRDFGGNERILKSVPSHFSFCLKINDMEGHLERLTLLLHSIPLSYRAPLYNVLGYFAYLEENIPCALKYFDLATSIDKDNLVGAANKVHVLRREEGRAEEGELLLERLAATLTSSPTYTKNKRLGRSLADLGWAHSFLGLNCVAERLFAESLKLDRGCDFARFGAALVQYNFSKHIDRMTEYYYFSASSESLRSIIRSSPEFSLPKVYLARMLNRRDRSQREGGMDPQASQLIKEVLSRPDPYTDYMVAKEKSRYGDWEGRDGSIQLLQRSIKQHPTSMAYLELAISKKGLILKDGNIDETTQIERNLCTMCGEKEEKETKPRSSHQQHRKGDKSKGAPLPPPPPPSPPLITESILSQLEEISRYLEMALYLNPRQDRCFLELANVSLLSSSRESALAYLLQAADNSSDVAVKARALFNLSIIRIIEESYLPAHELMERAFKCGLGTLCKVGPERPRVERSLVSLTSHLLNSNNADEAKVWIDYLYLVESPHHYELRSRYRAIKGIGSKSGGLKVSTAVSRTRKPQRTTQITKTSITGEKK